MLGLDKLKSDPEKPFSIPVGDDLVNYNKDSYNCKVFTKAIPGFAGINLNSYYKI